MRFRNGVPPAERGGNLVEAYARLLEHPDPAVREQAATDWCAWEDAVVAMAPDAPPNARYADPRFRMAFARIVTHYFRHNAWLEDGQLLRDAGRLAGIPGVLIHGRLDVSSPLETDWQLAQAWPRSELVIAERSGHSSAEPGMVEAIVVATDGFAGRAG